MQFELSLISGSKCIIGKICVWMFKACGFSCVSCSKRRPISQNRNTLKNIILFTYNFMKTFLILSLFLSSQGRYRNIQKMDANQGGLIKRALIVMTFVYYNDMQSKKGRKRIVKVIKNQQELAQDKLLEISCLAEDRFVDQSRMLSIEHVVEEKLALSGRLNQDLKNDLGKHKRASTKVQTQNCGFSISKYKLRAKNKKLSALISNKLQSNQVFVGFKPKTSIITKFQEINVQALAKQKGRTLSMVNHFQSKSIPVRKLTTQWSNELDFSVFEQKKRNLWNSFHSIENNCVGQKQQKEQDLRVRMKTELFFNRNNRHRRLTYNIPKFE